MEIGIKKSAELLKIEGIIEFILKLYNNNVEEKVREPFNYTEMPDIFADILFEKYREFLQHSFKYFNNELNDFVYHLLYETRLWDITVHKYKPCKPNDMYEKFMLKELEFFLDKELTGHDESFTNNGMYIFRRNSDFICHFFERLFLSATKRALDPKDNFHMLRFLGIFEKKLQKRTFLFVEGELFNDFYYFSEI